jgi:HSP20 family protein
MVELALKPDPQRPGIYILDNVQFLGPDAVYRRGVGRSHVWRPPTDVFETDNALIVRVEVAGMDEDAFSILLEGRLLTIRGTRSEQPERRAYHQMEIRFGEFSTEVELPHPVIADQAEATYSNGFLCMVLPKAQPQHIQVE